MQFFSFFLFGHNKTRNKVYDAVDRKETFFDYKNNTFSTTQKWHFPKVKKCTFLKLFVFSQNKTRNKV